MGATLWIVWRTRRELVQVSGFFWLAPTLLLLVSTAQFVRGEILAELEEEASAKGSVEKVAAAPANASTTATAAQQPSSPARGGTGQNDPQPASIAARPIAAKNSSTSGAQASGGEPRPSPASTASGAKSATSKIPPAPQDASPRPPTPHTARLPFRQADSPDYPDIYYIILDGYARQDVLRDVYGFDNGPFITWLKSRGFYVADRSVSNYPMTFLSLASSLNMRYLNDDARQIGHKRRKTSPILKLISDNEVGRYLHAQGYRYVHFGTDWEGTAEAKVADETRMSAPLFFRAEFVATLMRTTMLRPLAPSVANTHLFTLGELQDIPKIQGPTFTFAHLILPHSPYVFDRHGNVQNDIPISLQFDLDGKTGGWQNRQGYLEQVMFANTRIQEVIDAILKRSPYPPVIIIQSDHGSASTKNHEVAASTQPWLIRERMPILNCYYVPEKCRKLLYPSISPVNSFRVVFNGLFAAGYELLPDRHYFSWYYRPYKLADVTGLFDESEEVPAARLAN
jgi:hypothetical protein